MTRFEDGPAKGQTLMLKRVARFLRVTEAGGQFDALDQPCDRARPDEKLYAYEVFGEIGTVFVDGAKVHGVYPIANYRFIEPQPDDPTMRDNAAWCEWCLKRVGGRNEL